MSATLERSAAERTFTVPLCCLGCGQTGFALYERNVRSQEERSSASAPVAASDGFYLRMNTSYCFNIQIVCGGCGKVHRKAMR